MPAFELVCKGGPACTSHFVKAAPDLGLSDFCTPSPRMYNAMLLCGKYVSTDQHQAHTAGPYKGHMSRARCFCTVHSSWKEISKTYFWTVYLLSFPEIWPGTVGLDAYFTSLVYPVEKLRCLQMDGFNYCFPVVWESPYYLYPIGKFMARLHHPEALGQLHAFIYSRSARGHFEIAR